MKTLFSTLEILFVAVAYAEEGAYRYALEALDELNQK